MSSDNGGGVLAPSASPSVFPGQRNVPLDRPVYGDAYVTHFTLVLRTVARQRPDFRRLYSPRELALAELFLDRLTPLEQHVYARLFQRKGPWFKTSSLLSYFTRRPWKAEKSEVEPKSDAARCEGEGAAQAAATEPEPEEEEEQHHDVESVLGFLPEVADHRQVQTTVQTLVNAGLLLTPTLVSPAFLSKEDQDAHLLLALEAIQQCATSAELTALWKKLSGGKAKVPSGNRAIASASPLRPSKKNGDGTKDTATTGNTTASTGNGTSKGDVFQAIKRLVMTQRRIDGSRIPVAKLMHAIWLESYPLLQQQRNSKDDILLVVRVSDTARELFSRMHRLFYFQAAMPMGNSPTSMPASARVKSFQQVIQEKSGASRSGLDALTYAGSASSAQQWPGLLVIFKKVQYPSYEITIRHPIFQSSEAYICYEIASRLHHLLSGLELEMALTQVAKDDDVLPPGWGFSEDLFEHLPELAAFQRLILPPVESSVADEWQGRACAQFESLLMQWTTLDELVLETRKCLLAYCRHHEKAATSDAESERPVFYMKCNAGYHLARVLHHAATLYEKQRQYTRAVVVLKDLLAAPVFLPRKRAYWYERLALNCEHLKQHSEAKRVCEQALGDADVLGAGLLAIQRRHERLLKRKDLQVMAAAAVTSREVEQTPTKKRRIDPDDEDFVDLVSSSDEGENGTVGQVETRVQQQEVVVEVAETKVIMTDLPTALPAAGYPMSFIVGRPLNKSTGEKSRFVGYDDETCDVEQLVLQYYHSQTDEVHTDGAGWYGVHCEGLVLSNLFGLLMWDVLYAPIPDVFQSAYQSGPLDFGFATVFCDVRRDRIDTLLDEIEHRMTMREILELLESTWRAHEGEITRFVSWGSSVSVRFHQLVVAAMGQHSLAKLLRHMTTSEEYHRAQNGLPDLLILRVRSKEGTIVESLAECKDWTHPEVLDLYKYCGMTYSMNSIGTANGRRLNDQGKIEGTAHALEDRIADEAPSTEAQDDRPSVPDLVDDTASWQIELKLVEVKGPRDRLSDQQIRWLQLFNDEMGIDASVMHVVEEEKELEKRRQRANGAKKANEPQATAGSENTNVAVKRRRRD